VWAGLVDLLFPPRCAGCAARGALFCARCEGALAWLRPPLCARCGDALPGPAEPGAECDSCRRTPPAFLVARSLAAYEGPLRDAIRALKYRQHKAVAEPLGALLARSMPAEVAAGVGAAVPVPLHPARLASRGFNQSLLLARHVARALGVPLAPRAIRRVRQEASQAGLGASARRRNVLTAFQPDAGVPGGRVLLIDDVFSTGATADACARALLAAGAGEVAVLTLARAVLRLTVHDWRTGSGSRTVALVPQTSSAGVDI
jgi:ComF family protein